MAHHCAVFYYDANASIGPGADGREWLTAKCETPEIAKLQLGPALMAGNG